MNHCSKAMYLTCTKSGCHEMIITTREKTEFEIKKVTDNMLSFMPIKDLETMLKAMNNTVHNTADQINADS